jgi:thiamine biosynthesis lipoprotein
MRFSLLLLCLSCALFSPKKSDDVVLRRSFYLMGTICEIIAVAKDKDTAESSIQAGLAALTRVDELMSDYKPESEISTLSREGSQKKIPLSQETRIALQLSRRFSEISDGAFDITVGPLVDLWRSAHKQQKFPTQEEIDEAKQRVDFRAVQPDESGATLTRANMRLDLGALAKGFAEDLAADAMTKAGALGGRINMGGQVLVFGGVPKEIALVAVVDPRAPSKTLFTLSLQNESIATTADYERGKEIEGKKVSHVIDPRTGSPAQGMLAAVIIHPRGASADALSTVLFLLGQEKGANLVESQGALYWSMSSDEKISMSKQLQSRLVMGPASQ